MSHNHYETVTKPIAEWDKLILIDNKKMFISLSKAIAGIATLNWIHAAKDAVDAISALSVEEDKPAQIAWLLIRRALTRAIFDLVKDNHARLREATVKDNPPDAGELANTIDLALGRVEISINRNFFERPAEMSILEAFRHPFKQWLIAYGLSPAEADAVIFRLPSYFVFALNHEWRQDANVYAKIQKSMITPFSVAGDKELAWAEYNAWLQKQIYEPVFNETFSLRQIYVPLRAYYFEEVENKEGRIEEKRVVTELQAELDTWLSSEDQDDAIRIISGGPGSGKSSFSKIYAAHRSDNSQFRVLYIPLHLYNPKKDLITSIGEFIHKTELLPENPLESESSERLFIIFDGLDELALQGTLGAEVAREFVQHVEDEVKYRNYKKMRVKVLITGREVVVQENAGKFRKRGQILCMLPYFLNEKECRDYHDPQSLLKLDQRQEWWQGYRRIKGEHPEHMPEELKRGDLEDITAQPLLNYLIALSHARNVLDFNTQVNLNQIYEDLLKAVFQRDYADGIHPGIRELSLDHFTRVLEEIGLATWHGDGRTATIGEVHRQCTKAGSISLLEIFEEGAEAGVARFLTAFYFRQHDGDHRRERERTFEFTHKSFSEYLTARRIVRAIDRMYTKLNLDDLDDRWNERQALAHWAEIYGGAPRMTQDMFRFVSSEIQLEKVNTVAEWQIMLAHLINWMLQYEMPMELLDPRPRYQQENKAAIACEEALLASLNACARVTEQISKINLFQEFPTIAGDWLSRLQGQQSGSKNVLALQCLGFLDLQGCDLTFRNLRQADMRGADLKGANLRGTQLMNANLVGADMRGATLVKNFFVRPTHLEDMLILKLNEAVNLRLTNLRRVDLRRTDLGGAILEGAILEGADLEEANLEGADLEGANLEGTNLKGANLEEAYLRGATLPDGTKWTPSTNMRRFTHP